jgi:hypothetical protein
LLNRLVVFKSKVGVWAFLNRKNEVFLGVDIDMSRELENLNLRYLLWRAERLDRRNWTAILAKWLNCPIEKAQRILQGERLTGEQYSLIFEQSPVVVDEGEFFNRSLIEVDRVDVVRENVRFLLEQLRHGEAKQLGVALSVSDHTVSEWKRWRRKGGIEKQHLLGLARYFGIDPRVSLYTEPVFLWTEPIGGRQRREWLRRQITFLSEDELSELFPALKKLLSPRLD